LKAFSGFNIISGEIVYALSNVVEESALPEIDHHFHFPLVDHWPVINVHKTHDAKKKEH
jgi:hypothetical protein